MKPMEDNGVCRTLFARYGKKGCSNVTTACNQKIARRTSHVASVARSHVARRTSQHCSCRFTRCNAMRRFILPSCQERKVIGVKELLY